MIRDLRPTLAVLAFALTLAGCAGDDDEAPARPAPPPISTPAPPGMCAVMESRTWAAWVNAMPGPGASATLIVTGEVVVPTPGYTGTLTAGIADRSARPVQQLILTLTPPSGVVPQVLTPLAVRYDGLAISRTYSGVRIMCGGSMLTEITDVPVAQ